MDGEGTHAVLVLGASGMPGSAVLPLFAQSSCYHVVGTVRSSAALRFVPIDLHPCVITGVDFEKMTV